MVCGRVPLQRMLCGEYLCKGGDGCLPPGYVHRVVGVDDQGALPPAVPGQGPQEPDEAGQRGICRPQGSGACWVSMHNTDDSFLAKTLRLMASCTCHMGEPPFMFLGRKEAQALFTEASTDLIACPNKVQPVTDPQPCIPHPQALSGDSWHVSQTKDAAAIHSTSVKQKI